MCKVPFHTDNLMDQNGPSQVLMGIVKKLLSIFYDRIEVFSVIHNMILTRAKLKWTGILQRYAILCQHEA